MEALLQNQRSKSKIDTKELAYLLYRGKDRFEHIQEILALIEKVGGAMNPKLYEMSRVDQYAHVHKIAHKLRTTSTYNPFNDDYPVEELFVATNFHFPGSVGAVMGGNAIKFMGSEQQVKDWLPKLQNFVWLASYAQTELGAGSDVQNLKCLAVFDPKTQEFEFHSPTIDSVKCWPGDLGMACSHSLVMARLISNGTDYGVQAFFVEIRDPATHIPHKGVEVGDIGPKMGYSTKDNGFLKFNRFRVNKNCLLARYISIDEQGNVKKQGNPKHLYTALLKSRTALMIMSTSDLLKAVTIATRYSLFRTQFKDSKGKLIPVYEYQLQRDKLFRELSRAYVMGLSTSVAMKQVTKNAALVSKDDFSELQATHILLCAFKVMFTEWASEGTANLIRACGGHGYSMYSGLPYLYVEGFPNQILEGENSILILQVSRYLLKCFSSVTAGKRNKVTGKFAFILDLEKNLDLRVPSDQRLFEEGNVINLFKRATCYFLKQTGTKMFGLVKQHKDAKLVWDTMVSTDSQVLGRVYSIQTILEAAWEAIRETPSGEIKNALYKLFDMCSASLIEQFAAQLTQSGAINFAHLEVAFNKKNELLESLKNDGLVLAEGMQWPDAYLASAIGSSNKNPYETMYEWAYTIGTMNQFPNQIHPAVKEYQLETSRIRSQKL